MKTLIHIMASILLVWSLTGCNSDVFIDDFEPSVSELTLDGNGDAATIRFNSAKWDVLAVNSFLSEPVYYKLYDADGKLIEETSYPSLKGGGKIVYTEKHTDFIIERKQLDEVKVTVGENARVAPFQFVLMASNTYETKQIHVTILPSDRYVFDRITYSLDAYHYDGQQLVEKSRVDVRSDSKPLTWTFFPYKNEYRHVAFHSNDPQAFHLLAESNLRVRIPSMVDGYLEMDGAHTYYTSQLQQLPLPFSAVTEKRVTVPAYAQQALTLMLQYEWFETNYTLYAVHPKTGKQRTLTGTLRSRMPVQYYVKRESLNNKP